MPSTPGDRFRGPAFEGVGLPNLSPTRDGSAWQDKDTIESLQAQVEALRAENAQLKAQLQELQGRQMVYR